MKTPILEISPGVGVGPARLGDHRDAVKTGLEEISGALVRFSRHGFSDYYFNAALQVESDGAGRVSFIGASFHPACGCRFSLMGIDPWRTPAVDLFRLVADRDGSGLTYSPEGAIFPRLIVSLWEADRQYDYHGPGEYEVFAQIGVGTPEYLAAVTSDLVPK